MTDSMRWRLGSLAVAGLLFHSGCIEPRQDIAPADTAPDVNSDDVDQEEVAPTDADEVCDDVACAASSSACAVASCVGGRCVSTPVDGVCEPDTACDGGTSTQGLCVDGQCVVQAAGCETLPTKGCDVPLCVDGGNCTGVAVEGGFCVYDEARRAGTCDGLWMDPVDVCNSEGSCELRDATDKPILPDAAALEAREWWIVTQRLGLANARTFASRFDFDTTGAFRSAPYGDGTNVPIGERGRGAYCLDRSGGLAVEVPELLGGVIEGTRFLGQVARETGVLAATSLVGRELMLGVPVGGALTEMDGAYEVVLTRAEGQGDMSLWRGSLTFKAGALKDDGQFEGSGNGYASFLKDVSGFRTFDGANGVTRLVLVRELEGDEGTSEERFVGAVSPGGHVALLAAANEDATLGVGFILLLRLTRGAAMPEPGARGAWYAASQGPSQDPGGWQTSSALFVTRGDRVLQGLYGDGGAVWTSTAPDGRLRGGQLVWDDTGTMGAELRFGGDGRYFSGYLAGPRDFGFAVGVRGSAAIQVGSRGYRWSPEIPEFAVLVRRNP